ncbi:MAG: DUF222 domain-containing protein [Actinobacteria bacterium]|nr:DUF222 domain-containing protein [Actinomycetota bacterium]
MQNESEDARKLGERISEILHLPAGLDCVTELWKISPENLDYAGRVDYLAALEKQSGWFNVWLQHAIVVVAGNEPSRVDSMYSGVDDSEREEIATALRMSGSTAQSRIDVARTLMQHLPGATAALAIGDISPAHANVIARESAQLIRQGVLPEVLKLIEDEAVAHAEFHTPAQVANKVRSCIAMFAPEQFEAAAVEEKSARKVSYFPSSNGMATIVAFLPAPDAQTIMLAIDRLASKTNGIAKEKLRNFRKSTGQIDVDNAERFNLTDFSEDLMDPMDAHRADAITAIATMFLETNEDQIMNHGRPVTVNLTIDLPTLLGLAENPGQLSGYGPIPASVARELAADGKWRKFITDPTTGNLLDFGRESYIPPQILRDFLLARDRTCRFPGCRRSGIKGEIDHAIPWEEGGETTPSNLGLLCKRHHQLKTHGGWKLESFADGSCEWTSPLGKKRFVPARPMGDVA